MTKEQINHIIKTIEKGECPQCMGYGREYISDASGSQSEDIGECDLCEGDGGILTVKQLRTALESVELTSEREILVDFFKFYRSKWLLPTNEQPADELAIDYFLKERRESK